MDSERADALILGGGVAGLSCAVRLAEAGKRVVVLEKAPRLGGRARSHGDADFGFVDNGQHLLMGCYRATRRLLRLIGTEDRLAIYPDVVVDYAEPGGRRDRLSCPSWLPAPLHLGAGLLGLRGVSWPEKTALIAFDQALKALRRGPIPAAIERLTVRGWLDSLGVSRRFQTRFFDPAAIGILNETPEIASAAGFVQALRAMFYDGKDASRLALAKTGLSDLYADASRRFIEDRGGVVACGVRAAEFLPSSGGGASVVSDLGKRYDAAAVISALPPWELKKLKLPGSLRGPWERLSAAPIVGATVRVDRPVIQERMVGLLGTDTHWVFNKTRISDLSGDGQVLTVVASAARSMIEASPADVLRRMQDDLGSCLPAFSAAKILASRVVKEPFATLSPVPGAEGLRPLPGDGDSGFYFAGDWTRTGFPATIESGCVSGFAVAEKLLK
jgi:squalene-associated FAD-dependent desaturase